MTDWPAFLKDELRRRLEASTYSAVAQASGLDRATLHDFANGNGTRLTVHTARKVAAYLGYELRLVRNGARR